jgi:hypothetical protein
MGWYFGLTGVPSHTDQLAENTGTPQKMTSESTASKTPILFIVPPPRARA